MMKKFNVSKVLLFILLVGQTYPSEAKQISSITNSVETSIESRSSEPVQPELERSFQPRQSMMGFFFRAVMNMLIARLRPSLFTQAQAPTVIQEAPTPNTPTPSPQIITVMVERPPMTAMAKCQSMKGNMCALDGKCYLSPKSGTYTFSAAEELCEMLIPGSELLVIPEGATYENFYSTCLGESSDTEHDVSMWLGGSKTADGQCSIVMVSHFDMEAITIPDAPCEPTTPSQMHFVYCVSSN